MRGAETTRAEKLDDNPREAWPPGKNQRGLFSDFPFTVLVLAMIKLITQLEVENRVRILLSMASADRDANEASWCYFRRDEMGSSTMHTSLQNEITLQTQCIQHRYRCYGQIV